MKAPLSLTSSVFTGRMHATLVVNCRGNQQLVKRTVLSKILVVYVCSLGTYF